MSAVGVLLAFNDFHPGWPFATYTDPIRFACSIFHTNAWTILSGHVWAFWVEAREHRDAQAALLFLRTRPGAEE